MTSISNTTLKFCQITPGVCVCGGGGGGGGYNVFCFEDFFHSCDSNSPVDSPVDDLGFLK